MKTTKILFLFACVLLGYLPLTAFPQPETYEAFTSNDAEVYKSIHNFNVFFFAKNLSEEHAKKAQNLINTELSKLGKVASEPFDIHNPTQGKDNPSSSFNSPSLIYTIELLNDVHGKPLASIAVSLEYKGMVSIEKNNVEAQAVLWSRKCYVPKSENSSDLEIIKTTLPLLLQEFEANYKQANPGSTAAHTFYMMQP